MNVLHHIPEIEEVLGYTFKDKALLIQAFTRTSFCNEHRGGTEAEYQSNEVLEFFGDAVLSAAIISLLIRTSSERYAHGIHTALSEGDFSNVKSHLSDKSNLSVSMKRLGLQKYLLMGEGDKKMGMENEPSVMEDLFESLVGAIYIDCEMQMNVVIKSVSRMLDVGEYLESGRISQSPKNLVQEFCADKEHRMDPPVYRLISESGPQHKKVYVFACEIGGTEYGRGVGKNHREAETAAAKNALLRLQAEYVPSEQSAARHPADTAMSRLYEYAAVRGMQAPLYTERMTEESTAQNPAFFAVCEFGKRKTEGLGGSKRAARQAAAAEMMKILEKTP